MPKTKILRFYRRVVGERSGDGEGQAEARLESAGGENAGMSSVQLR